MATVTVTPAAPDLTDFVRVDVAEAENNDDTAYDETKYPASPQLTYYLTFELGGAILGKSYVFNVSSDGKHEFNNYRFPEAGSWTVRLSNAATDASVATASVTVS
jgi:hypothetical protein